MRISIITPFYEGNSYIESYLKCIQKAAEKFLAAADHSIELIFINDSPWEELIYNPALVPGIAIRCITNEKNCGIHKSRIHGVHEATGDYLLFLDQDDEITEDALLLLSADAKKGADIVLGNGIFEKKHKKELIYGNGISQQFATTYFAYKWIRDFVTSPGQCLFRKSSIPEYWLKHPLKNNGTDDYLLLLLMLDAGCKVVKCEDVVYVHKYTGKNYSLDDDKMFLSTREMLHLLYKNPEFSRDSLNLIKRRIYYKKIDRSRKVLFMKESLKNLDILFVNVLYRLVWRGCLIGKDEV